MSKSPDDLATNLYRALLGDPARLWSIRRMQYRCYHEKRCLLLDAVEVPNDGEILLHQIRYKYSPSENERLSNPAGRRANTIDGENHWDERTYFIGQSALAYPDDLPPPQLGISCDHVLAAQLLAPDFRADWNAGHAVVRVRADGSRYTR